ncbi:MAG: phosphoribosyltransferase [Simkania sp.]|nr:phosphoribosyltransferase [Simkania sp.]
MIFKNRQEAGKLLGLLLKDKLQAKEALVLGLPRGGIVVAYEVAKILGTPLDILCARKIGAPFNQELAIGAISAEGAFYLFRDLIERLHVSQDYIDTAKLHAMAEAKRQLDLYRPGKKPLCLNNTVAIIVDDGLATGATMRVALLEAKQLGAKKIIMAIPVAPIDTFHDLEKFSDQSFCLQLPTDFSSVGQFYADFSQTPDEEVMFLLEKEHGSQSGNNTK